MTVSRSRYELLQTRLVAVYPDVARRGRGPRARGPSHPRRLEAPARGAAGAPARQRRGTSAGPPAAQGHRRLGTVRELERPASYRGDAASRADMTRPPCRAVAAAVAQERADAQGASAPSCPAASCGGSPRSSRRWPRRLKSEDRGPRGRARLAVGGRCAGQAARGGSERGHRRGRPVYLPERLHAVRIAVKKFRYAVELEAEMSGDGA